MAVLHGGTYFICQCDDPGLFIPGHRPQRKHMSTYCIPLSVIDLKYPGAVFHRRFGMMKSRMFSFGCLFPEIIGAEVMKKSRSCCSLFITSQLLRQQPGQIGNMDAMSQSAGLMMMKIFIQQQKFTVGKDVPHFRKIRFWYIFGYPNVHRQPPAFFLITYIMTH